jgi:DNA polymerase III delta prime subunit
MAKQLWVETYRPKKIDEYVFKDEAQRRQVSTWIKEGSIPHLLFSGSAGIGKTTLAKVLLNELNIEDYDVLEINASRENSVDVIRDKITNFVQMIPFGPFKVVLLDEADYLTLNAQAILRGLMETYSSTSRFILTCNYPNKIIPALHSRCQGFHVEKTDQIEFTARVATILLNENVDFDMDTLDTYVKLTYPDLRKCINQVQQNITDDRILSVPTAGDSSASDYKIEMVELFKRGKIQEARKLLCGRARPEEMEDIYTWLYTNLDLLGKTDQQKDSAILIIKQGLVDHAICADSEINLAACLVKLARNLET